MSYSHAYGIANNTVEFLTAIRDFMVANGWVVAEDGIANRAPILALSTTGEDGNMPFSIYFNVAKYNHYTPIANYDSGWNTFDSYDLLNPCVCSTWETIGNDYKSITIPNNNINPVHDGADIHITTAELGNISAQVEVTLSNATVSNMYNGSYPGSNTIDGNTGTYWRTGNGVNTGWLMVQCGSTAINGYKIYSWDGTTTLKSWILEGSNDGNVWTTVDTKTNQDWTVWQNGYAIFNIPLTQPYTYYRLNISAVNGNEIYLRDIKLYAPSGDTPVYQPGDSLFFYDSDRTNLVTTNKTFTRSKVKAVSPDTIVLYQFNGSTGQLNYDYDVPVKTTDWNKPFNDAYKITKKGPFIIAGGQKPTNYQTYEGTRPGGTIFGNWKNAGLFIKQAGQTGYFLYGNKDGIAIATKDPAGYKSIYIGRYNTMWDTRSVVSSAPIAIGATTFDVTGDVSFLRTNRYYYLYGPKHLEGVKITNISGNTITVASPIKQAHILGTKLTEWALPVGVFDFNYRFINKGFHTGNNLGDRDDGFSSVVIHSSPKYGYNPMTNYAYVVGSGVRAAITINDYARQEWHKFSDNRAFIPLMITCSQHDSAAMPVGFLPDWILTMGKYDAIQFNSEDTILIGGASYKLFKKIFAWDGDPIGVNNRHISYKE